MEISRTQKMILESGKKWFLEKGFKSAPLRSIVSDTGYTLGAFYGYYKTKEDLFYALTDDTAEEFKTMVNEISLEMQALPEGKMLYSMMDCYIRKLPELVDFILLHKDEMTLLLRCSDGTKYEDFFGMFRMRNRKHITEGTRNSEKKVHDLDSGSMDYLMKGYFDILAGIVMEETERDRMIRMLEDVAMVYKNGILSLMEDNNNA